MQCSHQPSAGTHTHQSLVGGHTARLLSLQDQQGQVVSCQIISWSRLAIIRTTFTMCMQVLWVTLSAKESLGQSYGLLDSMLPRVLKRLYSLKFFWLLSRYNHSYSTFFVSFDAFLSFGWGCLVVTDVKTGKGHVAVRAEGSNALNGHANESHAGVASGTGKEGGTVQQFARMIKVR